MNSIDDTCSCGLCDGYAAQIAALEKHLAACKAELRLRLELHGQPEFHICEDRCHWPCRHEQARTELVHAEVATDLAGGVD